MQPRIKKHVAHVLMAVAISLPLASQAQSDWQLSGFASLIAGKVIKGERHTPYNDLISSCPCAILDWTNGGVYSDSWSMEPQSRLGVQVSGALDKKTRLTTQVVGRAVDRGASLEWFYLDRDLDAHWSVVLGRRRIPLYFYSEFQDIGVSYPWISPPTPVYGWEVSNFDGATLRRSWNVAGFQVRSSIFGGQSTVDDSRYSELDYDGRASVKWRNMVGADTEATDGFATVRLMWVKADVTYDYETGSAAGFPYRTRKNAWSIAFNLDNGEWFMLSELASMRNNIVTDGYWQKPGTDDITGEPAGSVGAGYHLGQWTPFLSYGHYKYDDDTYRVIQRSFTLRYDIDESTSAKFQWDEIVDDATEMYTGNSQVVRLSLDMTF